MKIIVLITLLFFSAISNATDIEAGKEKAAQVCVACHGMDGIGIDDTYPILAGQYADYLAKSLKDYRSGARKNAIMAGFAATLTDADIANLSAYYAQQENQRLAVPVTK